MQMQNSENQRRNKRMSYLNCLERTNSMKSQKVKLIHVTEDLTLYQLKYNSKLYSQLLLYKTHN